MSCNSTSYKTTLAACPEKIYLRQALPANTWYQWAIITQFGNIVLREARTDIEGTITIPASAFAAGHFNEHSGSYTLTLLTMDRDPLLLTFGGKEYDTVVFDFVKVDSTDIIYKNVIE